MEQLRRCSIKLNSKVVTTIVIVAGIVAATLIMMLVMNQQNTMEHAGDHISEVAYKCKIRLAFVNQYEPSEYAVNNCVNRMLGVS